MCNAVGKTCLKDEKGVLKVSVNDQKQIWKEHKARLMNVENCCIDASKVIGVLQNIDVQGKCYAMNKHFPMYMAIYLDILLPIRRISVAMQSDFHDTMKVVKRI